MALDPMTRKLAFVASADNEGGLSRLIELISKTQSRPGLKVSVVFTSNSSHLSQIAFENLKSRLSEFKVPVHRVTFEPRYPLVGKTGDWIWRPKAVCDFFLENRFEHIHFLNPVEDAFISVQTKRVGLALQDSRLSCEMTEIIAQNHFAEGWPEDPFPSLKEEYFERYIFENSDAVLFLNDQVATKTQAVGWKIRGEVFIVDAPKFFAPAEIGATPTALKTPSITVCIAHFNHGKVLPQALGSLKANRYPHFTVIVADDGSTDQASISAFDRLSREYPEWRFLRKSNGGPGSTRNFAASHADSDLLVFLDSDNIATPDMLSEFSRCMMISGSDCLSSSYLAFAGDQPPKAETPIEYAYHPIGPCVEVGAIENVFGDTTFCVQRSVFQKLHGFCEEPGILLEDWEFLCRLSLCGYRLDAVQRPLFLYRHSESGWGSAKNRAKSQRKILENFRLLPSEKLATLFSQTIIPLKMKVDAQEFELTRPRKIKKFTKKLRLASDLAWSAASRLKNSVASKPEIIPISRLLNPLSSLSRYTSEKPVVLVLPVYLAMGGAERNTVEIIRQLRDRYDFVVASTERLGDKQGSLFSQFSEVSVAVYELGKLASTDLHLDLLRSLKAAYQPSLVWICNGSKWQADHASDIRRIFNEIPIVDQQVYDTENGWITRFNEKGIRSSDRFIAITKKIESVFLNRFRMNPTQIDVIYSALDTSQFKPRSYSLEERKTLLAKYGIACAAPLYALVGRMADQKRPLDFLELALLAQNEGRKEGFVLIGEGDLSAKIDEFIARNRLTNVFRIGFTDRLAEIYPLLSGLVVLSEYEGLPIVMLEALACGIPVLSTDVGDIRSVLEEYKSGLVLPKIGNVALTFDYWKKWTASIESYRAHAVNSAARVRERFSSKTTANQYDLSWKKAISEFHRE